MKNLDHYLEKAIVNIESDRETTKELLDDVMRYLSKNEQHHKEVGGIAAKYVETLQRSNEQLVKVSTIIYKQQGTQQGLSDGDKADIFDMLQDKDNKKESE
tara:strand:- start:170 stop:472 length:303 start_codon:yes stop_codon:yes gene_type:complete